MSTLRKSLIILFALVAFGQVAWSQTTVTTESQLTSAVQTNNANIQLGNNIMLSTYLNINGKTVTIDLNGHKLYRNITGDYSSSGHVIYVHNSANLTLNNSTGTGIIEGGMAYNGGAIFIEPGSTVNTSNVTFQNNSASEHAGAIWNGGSLTASNCTFADNMGEDVGGIYNAVVNNTYCGTATLTNCTFNGNVGINGCGALANATGATFMTLNNCTVTGNTATTNGGGIWNGGTLTIIGGSITGNTCDSNYNGGGIYNNGTLKMSGNPVVSNNYKGNRTNNVYLNANKVITVTGAFTEGANIGITMSSFVGNFTSGFKSNNPSTDPTSIFFPDNSTYMVAATGNEVCLQLNSAGIPYISRSWNSTTKEVESEELACTDYTLLDGSFSSFLSQLGDGWYVVYSDITFSNAIIINGDVKIILADGATLTAGGGIYIVKDKTLTVYGQSANAGKIYSHPDANIAGIGGIENYIAGHFIVHGGTIDAMGGSSNYAGIGGGDHQSGIQEVTIYGGNVYARGRNSGAGIGKGQQNNHHETITIYGGRVRAYGDNQSAGIGGGEDRGNGTVYIYGGSVTALGGLGGAGIGGGTGGSQANPICIYGGGVIAQGGSGGAGIGGGAGFNGGGNGGNITITGGTVISISVDQDAAAIGKGAGGSTNGNLTLGADLMVTSGLSSSSNQKQLKANRINGCRNRYAMIEPCDHENANYSDENTHIGIDCNYCYKTAMPYTFCTDGDWHLNSNWFQSFMPHEGTNVDIKAAATIDNGNTANVGNITIKDGSIDIEDGGQLICANSPMVTVKKQIMGYESNTDKWYFIANPTNAVIQPDSINDMLSNGYDLYQFLQNPPLEEGIVNEWRNYKMNTFDLINGEGYLYANSEDVDLAFKGNIKSATDNGTVALDYADENPELDMSFRGWNLVGNPFTFNAYSSLPYYKMNDEGDGIIAIESISSDAIAPCTGVLVKVTESGQSVTFSRTAPAQSNGSLNIALSQPVLERAGASTGSATLVDNAIVSFNQGNELEKFYFGDNAKLYIPQGNKDYAIAFSEGQGEMPLNFKAMKDGTYTITVNPDGVEMGYLHLIDNMTGADVDLLAERSVVEPVETPTGTGPSTGSGTSYTFNARTTDYESRFKLVFACGNGPSTGSGTFAYISNGNIIVNGEGTLQVVDVMGRIIRTVGLSQCGNSTTTAGMTPGVYVLRLINNNDIKTQKIIIK